jgi:hypothetical protein
MRVRPIELHKKQVSDSMTVLLACASLLFAFGQNKVQYEKLNWRFIDSPHLNVYFHQNCGELPDISTRWMEQDYRDLKSAFGFGPKDKIPLVVYGSPNLFQETNIIYELLPEEVGGFTELFKSRIVVPFDGSYADFRHVIHHELVHAFEYAVLYEQFGSSIFKTSSIQLPLWFAEGLAEFLSSGWNTEADMFLMDRVIYAEVPLPGMELDGYMAYKGGQSFFNFLSSTRGDSLLVRFLKNFRASKTVDAALKETYGKTPQELGEEWIREIRRLYWPEIGCREEPSASSKQLTFHEKTRTYYNLKPRISPDGKKIAYFSDTHDYTEIVVSDLKGAILTRIGQFGYGGFFESFHPFRSGLCWSPKGDKLAFVTQNAGKDEIRIVSIDSKKAVDRIPLPFSSANSPDWSWDGSRLVVCGTAGHLSDLYLFDLSSHKLQRLTHDPRCESSPRFAPDGTGIIFAAQDSTASYARFPKRHVSEASDLYYLTFASGEIRRLTASPVNERQPAFSGDGKNILFISDKNGIDNIYCAPIADPDSARPVTDFIGGCSDPDWARSAGRAAFCLFQKQGWDIWSMEKPLSHVKDSALKPTRWAQWIADSSRHFFNPAPVVRDSAKIAQSKARPDTAKAPATIDSTANRDSVEIIGLDDSSVVDDTPTIAVAPSPADTSGAEAAKPAPKDSIPRVSLPYSLKFSPDMVSVGLGVNSLYGYAAGQAVIVLSDIMGDHQITFAGDLEGRIDQFAHLYLSYVCMKHRLDFGVAGFYSREHTSESVYGDNLYRDTHFGGQLLLSYPFSRSARADFNIYTSQVDRMPVDSYLKRDNTRPADRYTILIPSLSGVFDNILWGLTGPINGVRAQATLMASPPVGMVDDSFISADLDFRLYWHILRRFVWANRVALGASQPLKGGVSARRYFLGGTDNWLNFQPNIDNYEANIDKAFYSDFVVPFRGWDYFDLTGSRYAVLNTEFRFPFVKDISIVWPVPIEIRYINGAFFTDVGNAWDPQDEYRSIPLPQNLYGGIGYGLRVNLGIFVLRFDRGWKTDWHVIGSPTTYFSLGAEF